MNLPWANRISPEIRIEFVGKMKGNYNNLSELCKEYNISRPTAYKWIAAYQDGYLCVRCEETPFFFLESKLCRSCKKVENLSLDEKVEREAQAIKCYGYSRMDELYSQGKLFKDEEMNLEAITILELYEQGKTTEEIKNIFDKEQPWISLRLAKMGTSIRECRKNYKLQPGNESDIAEIKRKLKKISLEVGYLKMRLTKAQNNNIKKWKGKRRLKRIGE